MISFTQEVDRPVGPVQRSTHPAQSSPIQSVDRSTFIDAMARAVNGVSIVTTDGRAGRFGITVSSVTSVSADPPLVLVCINSRSPAAEAIEVNGRFCVNLRSTVDRELAGSFAGYPANGKPFDFGLGEWSQDIPGAPRLKGAVASFECVLVQAIEAGSHTVFFGRSVGVGTSEGASLLYTTRAYGSARIWR